MISLLLHVKEVLLLIYFTSHHFSCQYSEPYVTEDELKLMLRGAELSGAIEEEEQVPQSTLIDSRFLVF